MKNYFITLIGVSILIFPGCSQDESGMPSHIPSDNPLIHDTIEIDINDDGLVDYYIQFDQPYFGGPNEGVLTGLIGRFLRYGENEILRNKEERSLFLRNLDEIKVSVPEPLFWDMASSNGEIVSITTNAVGVWPTGWSVNSETEQVSYLLGLKLIRDTDIQLGWVEIEINTSDGHVSVVDKGTL